MTNVKKSAEQLRITGKNYDAVIRQIAEKYHAGNGWAIVRTIDRIITMDVYVERSGNYSSEEVGAGKGEWVDTKAESKEGAKEVLKEEDKPETSRKVAPKTAKATKEIEK